MKKVVLIFFLAVIAALQLPYANVMGSDITYSLKTLSLLFTDGIINNQGTLLIYALPLLGVITSLIGIFFNKKTEIITSLLGLLGVMYSAFVYFAFANIGANAGVGFIVSLISYIFALTFSVVILRVNKY